MRKRRTQHLAILLGLALSAPWSVATTAYAQASLFSDGSFAETAASGLVDTTKAALERGQTPNTNYKDHFVSTAVIISSGSLYPTMIALFKEHGLDWKAVNPVKEGSAFDRPMDQEEENLYYAASFHRPDAIKAAIAAGADPTSTIDMLKQLASKSGDPARARGILASLYQVVPALAPVQAAKAPPDPSILGVRLGMTVAEAAAAARSHGLTQITPFYVAQLNGRHGPMTRIDASAPTKESLGTMSIYPSAATGSVMMISYANEHNNEATTTAACVEKWGQPETFDKDGKAEPPTWGDPDHLYVRCQGNQVVIIDKDAQTASQAGPTPTVKPHEKF